MEEQNKKTKSLKIITIVFAIVIILMSFFAGFITHKVINSKTDSADWVASMIDKYYYSEEEGVIKEFSSEDYANAIVSTLLDQYSSYYNAVQYQEEVKTDKGNYFGFGFVFLINQKDTVVFNTSPNSPAYKAGVIGGDKILSAEYNGTVYEFSDYKALSDFLKGVNENEKALFKIDNGETVKDYEIKKEVYVKSYVLYKDKDKDVDFVSEGKDVPKLREKAGGDSRFDEKTAYISLSSFHGEAGNEMGDVMNYLKQKNKTKLILDLRDNGGGDMLVLCKIASYFVYQEGQDAIITFVKSKDQGVTEYRASGNNFNKDITAITVLADENTASASECLIGAMQYYKRGFSQDNLIIEKNGEGVAKTYGKGIMQTTFVKPTTGEAIKLTTAYLYQPDKTTSIHKKGFIATGDNAVEKGDPAVLRALAILG